MWQSKIARARHHAQELQTELDLFIISNPYKINTKTDPKTDRLIYFVGEADIVPEKISLIAGDVIQNLRSALDHLAYKLFEQESGSVSVGRHIYFPIEKDFTTYESEKGRKTDGIGQKHKDIIDSVKPYKGGNDILWKISELNKIDKHRLLITVGSCFSSLDLGPHIDEQIKKLLPNQTFQPVSLFLRPSDNLFPLKAGDELFIDQPGANVIPNMKFRFDVVLNEPGVVEGSSIIEELEAFIREVESLVPLFN